MAAMSGLIFLAWPLARAVDGLTTLPSRMLLVNAGSALTSLYRPTGPPAARVPSVGLAFAVLALYLAVFLTAAFWRFARDR